MDERLLVAAPDDAGARRDLQTLLRELPQAQQQAIVLTKLGIALAGLLGAALGPFVLRW